MPAADEDSEEEPLFAEPEPEPVPEPPGGGEPEQDDIVYLQRFYQEHDAGMEAAHEWGVEGWSEADWTKKFETILGTYKKKGEKAAKHGKTGAEADYKEILFASTQAAAAASRCV